MYVYKQRLLISFHLLIYFNQTSAKKRISQSRRNRGAVGAKKKFQTTSAPLTTHLKFCKNSHVLNLSRISNAAGSNSSDAKHSAIIMNSDVAMLKAVPPLSETDFKRKLSNIKKVDNDAWNDLATLTPPADIHKSSPHKSHQLDISDHGILSDNYIRYFSQGVEFEVDDGGGKIRRLSAETNHSPVVNGSDTHLNQSLTWPRKLQSLWSELQGTQLAYFLHQDLGEVFSRCDML